MSVGETTIGEAFLNMEEANALCERGEEKSGDMAILIGWVQSYLMAAHSQLGRTGAVCPFTKQAAKINTVRLAISSARSKDEKDAFSFVRRAFQELNAIPCKEGMHHFRTVIIGFPRCIEDEGIAMLKRVQRSHRAYSLTRGRMIGLMHPGSDDPGLWNNNFRPLRAPIPVVAIRHMVEQDAPFAALHLALMLAYLAHFPLKGTQRLLNHWRADNG